MNSAKPREGRMGLGVRDAEMNLLSEILSGVDDYVIQ